MEEDIITSIGRAYRMLVQIENNNFNRDRWSIFLLEKGLQILSRAKMTAVRRLCHTMTSLVLLYATMLHICHD